MLGAELDTGRVILSIPTALVYCETVPNCWLEILGVVGPTNALLVKKWPSLLLVKRKAALSPCCDGRYILPCRRILAGQYSPA